jgi:hypothetical protein
MNNTDKILATLNSKEWTDWIESREQSGLSWSEHYEAWHKLRSAGIIEVSYTGSAAKLNEPVELIRRKHEANSRT